MTDEQLIEEAAKAIYRTRYPESRPDLADLAWESVRNMPEGVDIRDEASAALAVFEKALGEATVTPTDDEREALGQVIFERSHTPDDALNLWDGDINKLVDTILAAGFRRSEVPEPRFPYASEWEQPETIIERVLDDAGYDLFQPWRTGVVNAIAAWVNEAGRAVEPQGEPSDTQRYRAAIEDALPMLGLFRAWNTSPEQIENVRVILARALRAANNIR